MVKFTKLAKVCLAVSTLVAVGCIVGIIVMVVTMTQSPPLTDLKDPATQGLTGQLPSSTDIILDDSITSLTTSKVYEAETQDSKITGRQKKGRIDSPAVAEHGGNSELDPTMIGLSTPTTSPHTNGFIGDLIRSVLSLMDAPDLQRPEDQRLLNIMLIEIVNATYSRPTPRMEPRKSSGKSLLPSFDENFGDGEEEMESENRSTLNIAKMVNGLARSSDDGYLNKPETYDLNIEKQSTGTASVEVDDSLIEINKFMLNLIRAVYGTGYANMDDSFNETQSLTLATERQTNNGVEPSHLSPQSTTLKIVIDKMVIGVASSNTNDTLNRNATFKVNIKRQVNGQGYPDSIDSSSGAEPSEIPMEKTAVGITSSNINNQAIDDTHVFELDINTVMEEIAASDILDESDDNGENFDINIDRQLNGLGHYNSTDSSSDDDISDIDIEKTINGIGSAETNNQAIDDTHVFELDINTVMEEITASDILDESDDKKENFDINIERQLNGLGHSNSTDSSSDDDISYIDIEKTTNGIGFSNTNKEAIDETHVFELDINNAMEKIAASDVLSDDISHTNIEKVVNRINYQITDKPNVFELEISKDMKGLTSSKTGESNNVNATFKVNVTSQLSGLGSSGSLDSPDVSYISDTDIEKTSNGMGFTNTYDQSINEAQVFELDVSKEMKAIALFSDLTDHPDNVNEAVKFNIERQLNGLGHTDSMTLPSGNEISDIDMEKTENGIGLYQATNDDSRIFKLDVDKDMMGTASSGVSFYPHNNSTTGLDVEKTAIGTAFSGKQNLSDAKIKNPEFNQKQVVGIASTNLSNYPKQPNNFANINQEITGIGSARANNENSNEANDIKLDIGKVMEGVASSAVFDHTHYNMEKRVVGVASSITQNSGDAETKTPELNIQKQTVGIASTNLGRFSNQPNNFADINQEITGIGSARVNNENSNEANDIKLDIGKVMEGVASSSIIDDYHYNMEKKAVGVASSSTSNGAGTENLRLDIQTKAVGRHVY